MGLTLGLIVAAAPWSNANLDQAPQTVPLIPAVIHQLWVGSSKGSFGDTERATAENSDTGGPEHEELRAAMAAWQRAARRATPSPWQYRFWNRSSAEALLGTSSAALLEKFRSLAKWPERQKDLFQFFVLGRLGGIFSDVDVLPLQEPSAWFRRLGASITARTRLLVGIEARGTESDAHAWRWAGSKQLAMWTVGATPGHPVMLRAVDRIVQSDPPPLEIDAQYRQSIELGPGLLTKETDRWLQEVASTPLERLKSVFGKSRATCRADTAVLNIDGFGCGQPHSRSRRCNETNAALVKHLFFGGWKAVQKPIGWEWDDDSAPGRRRRRQPGEIIDWRLPALALHAHLNASGVSLPFEAIPLLFSRVVPTGPPLLPPPVEGVPSHARSVQRLSAPALLRNPHDFHVDFDLD